MRILSILFLLSLSPIAPAQFGMDTLTYANGWHPTHSADGVASVKEGLFRHYDLPYTAYLRLHNDTVFELGTLAYGWTGIEGHTGRWVAQGDTLLLHCLARVHGEPLKGRQVRTAEHDLRAVRGTDGLVTVLDRTWKDLRLLPHPVEERAARP